MIELQRTRRFDRDYGRLPARIREAAALKLNVLAHSPRHPSLRLKRIKGSEAYWEMSITMQYRVVLEFVSEDHVVLLRIGTHKIIDKP